MPGFVTATAKDPTWTEKLNGLERGLLAVDRGADNNPPLTTYSGIAWDAGPNDDLGYDGSPVWRVARPFPANIIAIAYDIQVP